MLQFDLQFYEELTVAWVNTVRFISGAFFGPTGQLVFLFSLKFKSSTPYNNVHRVNRATRDITL